MKRILGGLCVLALVAGAGAYFYKKDFVDFALTTNPIAADAATLQTGQALFLENCAACHGVTGRGDGELAADMTEKPKNLALSSKSALLPGRLAAVIKYGAGEGAMPAFGDALSDDTIWALDHYIATLR
ncbi:MAG: c-type cytochrome [Pseudomonadota bacterium]